MSSRTLVIVLAVGLAVSVAANLFAAAAAFVTMTGQARIEQRLERPERTEHRPTTRELVAALPEPSRARVRQALREAGLAARADFQEARVARREAVALASAPAYDAVAVQALLARSRAAEARGRETLETEATVILGTLSVEERRAFAAVLERRGRGGGQRDRDRPGPRETSPGRS